MKNNIKFSHSARIILLIFCILSAELLTYAKSARTPEAEISQYQKELAKSPSNIKIKTKLAEVYSQNKQFADVIKLLKTDSDSLTRTGLIILAKAYAETEDRSNQSRVLEHLVSLNQNDFEALVLWGEYFITLKQDEEAIRTFRQALAAKPYYKVALDNLLLIYQTRNNNFEMRLIYQDLIKHYGKKPEYISKLCKIHTLEGFYDTAKKYCRLAAKLDSKNPENYLYMAYIEQSLGNTNQTNKIIKMAMQKYPDSNVVLSSYAAILIRHKNFAGAEKYFLQATKINGDHFDSQIGLAISSFESKNYEIALSAYKSACKLEPHKTAQELKRASNFIRYKSMEKWEDAFTSAFETCIPSDYSNNKKKTFVSLADLRKPKPYTPFSVPLTMDIKVLADPASLKKPDGSTIFQGQNSKDSTSTGSTTNSSGSGSGSGSTFTGSEFAPSTSPFTHNGAGAGHMNDSTPPATMLQDE